LMEQFPFFFHWISFLSFYFLPLWFWDWNSNQHKMKGWIAIDLSHPTIND
jgi:hypothetical protein